MGDANHARFWRLENPDRSREVADWDDGVELEQVICPRFPGHQRAGKRIGDLKVVLQGHAVGDFIWVLDVAIRDRVLRLLRDSGITGFEVRRVAARFAHSREPAPALWQVVVTGWAGTAKPESGIHLDESRSCQFCGHLRYTGLINAHELVDPTKWDGSDFFMVWPMPGYILVTRRVVDIILEHGLTGVRCTPVSELEATDGFAPGRLHYYMPEPRARQLGEPLGIY